MKKLKFYYAGVLTCLLSTGGSAFGGSFGPGGLLEAKLFSARLVDETLVEYVDTGSVQVWNTRDSLQVKIAPLYDLWHDGGWKIRSVDLYVGVDPVPVNADGMPIVEEFTYRQSYGIPINEYRLVLPFQEAMNFQWGEPYEYLRFQNISVHADMVQIDATGMIISQKDVWTFNPAFEVQPDEYETVVVGENTVVERDVRTKVVPVVPVGYTLDVQNGILGDMLEKHWGYVTYEMAHPKRAHFIDSPVAGMRFKGPTQEGVTDIDGAFDYFPGERVDLWVGPVHLGNPSADDKISPIDVFEEGDTNDPRVISMARFLQSLDADGDTQGGITISADVTGCLSSAMTQNGLTGLDWADDSQVDSVINDTITACAENPNTHLISVSADAAKEHLDSTLSGAMFRKNVSRTPVSPSAKAKMDGMGVWIPALKADGSLVEINYRDENGNDLAPGQTGDQHKAKPLIVTYTDADPVTGDHDVWIAISRDDGATWKRKNISRMADRSSFTDATGKIHYGNCKKPVVAVKNNYIMVAWTSKYARGGKPRYSINVCPDTDGDGSPDPCQICKTVDGVENCETDYTYDDPYAVDDIWGVKGPQRSHDYTEEGYDLVGEVPYSALWTCRITVDKTSGDITYFKPERLTSGRRDAYQLFLAGAGGAGFAMVWQEDPKGLQPGDAKGPGPGWGGATTSHKTDIWYSFIPWADFAVQDANFVINGDPEHDFTDDFEGRPKALVPMSLPVRLTDNDAVNTDNLMVQLDPVTGLPVTNESGEWIPLVNTEALSYDGADANEDGSGSHRYGYEVAGLCTGFYEFVNNDDATKRACITADGRLLDGNTGASRPNIFLQPYYRVNPATGLTEKSAYAIVVYEETKGAGLGTPVHDPLIGEYGDDYTPDEGKNAHYHTFDFTQPDRVSRGSIINHPETDELGNPVYIKKPVYNEDGSISYDAAGNMVLEDILDWQGKKILAYENARRPRIILQPKSEAGPSKTVAVVLYKEGEEGKGRPSDIMMRRIVVPLTGNPYAFANMVCDQWAVVDNGETICVKGARNISTVTPTATWVNPTAEPDSNGDNTKITKWEQRPENLDDKSGANPYEDARAHRGALQGDFLIVGYTYTPNWAPSRNAHDKFDFFVRRSFDGGQTWTTDPAGQGVTHSDTFKVYLEGETEDADITREKYTVETFYGPGQFEPAVNLSQLKNNKETVIEPRIVGTPGQNWQVGPGYKPDGTPITPVATGYPEDIQDDNVVWMSYGTSENLPKEVGYVEEDDGEHVHASAPLDLYYSFSQDKGEQFHEATWVVNPDSDGNNAGQEVTGWARLAKGDPEQGEAQLRMTPDGSRFYAVWLQEGIEGSDIWLRRIMPAQFSARNLGIPPVDAEPAAE